MPYQLTCKILQKLHNARLVDSCMGPKGGFRLSRKPSKISLLDVIVVIQGPVLLNRCLLGVSECPRRPRCAVSNRLAELQRHIDSYLGAITLDELSTSRLMKKTKTNDKLRRKNV
jgi:Rrf2 family protein